MMKGSTCTKKMMKNFKSEGNDVTTLNSNPITDPHPGKYISPARARKRLERPLTTTSYVNFIFTLLLSLVVLHSMRI
jgi:hypothetical protein